MLQRASRHARPVAAGVATLGLVVLAVVALGPAGTIVLAGGWLLACGLGRTIPGLDGPVSWAAAVVVEVCIVCALSLLLALLSPRAHGVIPTTMVLAAPAVVGLLLVGVSTRFREPSLSSRAVMQRPALAAIVTGGALAVTSWVSARAPAAGVAWAMSGDARNHVRVMRGTLADGGLTLEQLRAYPALVDTMSALISAADGRSGLAPGALMLHDARAMATTYVLALIGLALLFVAALHEFLPPGLAAHRHLPAPIAMALLGASALSGSSLLLGTGLLGGFLSGYGSIPFAVAGLVLALRLCSRQSAAAYGLLGPAIMLSVFGWTILAVVPVVATVVVTVILVVAWQRDRRAPPRTSVVSWACAAASAVGSVLVTVGIVVSQWTVLEPAFLLPGAITSPQPRLLPLIGILGIAVLLVSQSGSESRRLVVVVAIAVLGLAAVYGLRAIAPGPLVWTYYAIKTLWLVTSCLIWVVFIPLLRLPQTGSDGWAARLRGVGAVSVGSLALLIALGFTTVVQDPLEQAAGGWFQPTAVAIDRTARAGDRAGPFVLWDWSDPGNDRLANFWAGAVWGTDGRGNLTQPDVVSWAYVETGQLTDLCRMAQEADGLRIITRSPALAPALEKTCPGTGARVVLDRG
jgi:hypothetical protein